MTILFAGGGSLGPVTPLLATAKTLRAKHPHIHCVWMGTPDGPERALVDAAGIPFSSLPILKWPRYVSRDWFSFPWRWWHVRCEARRLLETVRPDAVVSAGGFTATPIIQQAAKMGVPCFVHQLDLEPGLANRLVAPLCVSVTTSFEYEVRPFGERVCDEPMPTPVRYVLEGLPSRANAARAFGLDPAKSIVCIYGGGQGAQALNEMIEQTRETWLTFTQVIHLTGRGKAEHLHRVVRPGYVVRAVLDAQEMREAHAAADVEIIRGGMGSLSEVAALKKAAVVVPMPDSHQETNARAFEEQGGVLVFDQCSPTCAEDVLSSARLLLRDHKECKAMGTRAHRFFPTDDGTAFAERILKHLSRSYANAV